MRKHVVIVGLLGAVAALLLVLVVQCQTVPAAQGQAGAVGADKWLMATATAAGSGSTLYLFNTETLRFAVYNQQGKNLQLVAVRTIAADFLLKSYGTQQPTVEQVESQVKKP